MTSELFHAVSDAAEIFGDGQLQHDLGEHVNNSEMVALARIFLAGGYANVAHGLIEGVVTGDYENHVHITEYDSGGIGVSFRDYDEDEFWYAVYPETAESFASRLDLNQTGKSTYSIGS